MGQNVTDFIKTYKQPRGGFINPSGFETKTYNDKLVLSDNENLQVSLLGLVVDYMSRFLADPEYQDINTRINAVRRAFDISLKGAYVCSRQSDRRAVDIADNFVNKITGLDFESCDNAAKLVTYDVWFRQPAAARMGRFSTYQNIRLDDITFEDIKIMIQRSLKFIEDYGPIVKYGFTFEPENPDIQAFKKVQVLGHGNYGGYSAQIIAGEGDFLTEDTIWDFKVSKNKPTSKHSLQLLLYYVMAKKSGQEIYKNVHKIGLFNPRINKVYTYDMNTVPKELIEMIERDLLKY